MGDVEPKESAAFKVSRRGVADLSGAPLQVQVGGKVTQQIPGVEGEREPVF